MLPFLFIRPVQAMGHAINNSVFPFFDPIDMKEHAAATANEKVCRGDCHFFFNAIHNHCEYLFGQIVMDRFFSICTENVIYSFDIGTVTSYESFRLSANSPSVVPSRTLSWMNSSKASEPPTSPPERRMLRV